MNVAIQFSSNIFYTPNNLKLLPYFVNKCVPCLNT